MIVRRNAERIKSWLKQDISDKGWKLHIGTEELLNPHDCGCAGDVEPTHLVKGLDSAWLLHKVRTEIDWHTARKWQSAAKCQAMVSRVTEKCWVCFEGFGDFFSPSPESKSDDEVITHLCGWVPTGSGKRTIQLHFCAALSQGKKMGLGGFSLVNYWWYF